MLSITDTLCVRRCAGRSTAAASARFASVSRVLFALVVLMAGCLFSPASLMAQEQAGGEANLKLPDLGSATFLGGISGHNLLLGGLVVSALGLVFGLMIFVKLAQHAGARRPCAKYPS